MKPPKAVPNENEDVPDSELWNSLLFDDDSDNNEDDLLADVLPNRNDCNMDLVYKELDKDPKFRNVSKWLKGIEGNLILPKGEQLMVESPQQRDEGSKSSYRLLDPEASICNRNEMSEFEKYLTGNSYTEQKNINDGAAVLTATLTGHENDCISVQKSVEDDVVNAKDDSGNAAGRNSGDVEGIENSNSVQNS